MNWLAIALAIALSPQEGVPTPENPTPLEQATPTLSMEEAVAIGIENGYAVQIARANEDRARANRNSARSADGFKINFQGQYFRIFGSAAVASQTGNGTRQEEEPPANSSGGSSPDSFNSLVVSLIKPIDISGSLRANVRAADWFIEAATYQTSAAINETKGTIRNAYLQALQAQELLEVQSSQLKNAVERRDTTEAAFRIGERPRFDVLRLENEVQRSNKAVLDAENTLVVAKQALNNAMSRPIDTPITLVEPQDELERVAENADLVTRAIARRAELDASQARIAGLQELEFVSATLYRPSLNLSASHTRVVAASPGQDQSSLAGLILSVPLVDAGQSRAAVRTAEANTLEAELQQQQLELGIALAVRSARSNYETAVRGLTFANNSVELSAEAYRLAKLLYDEGEGPLLDVLTSQNDLTAALSSRVVSLFEVRRARAALQQAVGDDDLSPEVEA
ncbi:MAG: TolC family protein [Fimbriimonadaceae bacterium]|nr:TolC family protein [Fimbriimonadaceae bacterium]